MGSGASTTEGQEAEAGSINNPLEPNPGAGWPSAESYALSQVLFDFADVDFSGVLTVEEIIPVIVQVSENAGLDPPDEDAIRSAVEAVDDNPEAPATSVTWSNTMKAICKEAGCDAFREAVNGILREPPAGGVKITVGPVIGKVTEATARIVVETNDDTELTCTLTPDPDLSAEGSEAEPVSETIQMTRGRPNVFRFEGLVPAAYYLLSFEGAEVLVDRSGFRTLPEGGWNFARGDKPVFAVASCNKVYTSRALPKDTEACLWKDLERRLRDNPLSIVYGLHLGDNVYNDSEWYLVEKGKKALEGRTCKWGVALQWLKEAGTKRENWATKEEEITELFRTAYRETWGYPATRYALANMPNLMIFDDHDIRDDWGDREVDMDSESLDNWLGRVAYRVVNEYQNLMRIDDPNDLDFDHHLHNFGDVGVVFVDVRGCKTFHKVQHDPAPFLGTRQWRDLEDAVIGNGLFAHCKTVFWLMAVPIAYVDPTATMVLGHVMVDDLLGQWSARAHAPEVPRFLNLCMQWQKQVPGREAIIVGGDVHEGGWTDIVNCDKPDLLIRQLTTSAIANKMTKPHEALAVTCTRNLAAAWNGFQLPGGYSARHYDWTNHRNYALLDCSAAVTGGLRVKVVAAYGLRNADASGSAFRKSDDKSDPYAVVTVGKKKHKTAVIDDCLDPEWNEGPFSFEVGELDSQIKLEVKDKDKIGKDDHLGTVFIGFRSDPAGEPTTIRTGFDMGWPLSLFWQLFSESLL